MCVPVRPQAVRAYVRAMLLVTVTGPGLAPGGARVIRSRRRGKVN